MSSASIDLYLKTYRATLGGEKKELKLVQGKCLKMSGKFAWSLTFTDVYSRWTEIERLTVRTRTISWIFSLSSPFLFCL